MSGNFYRAFEDRYRGSRDLIKKRLQVYQPFLAPLAANSPARALDLGCGRGEWLELLGEAGFAARGVDLDEAMLDACRERGLDAVNGDAIGALRATPDASLAVVSAFHLVEHIAFEQVRELIAEALRALRPGGLLILETPNPENLVVGTSSFYDDPSHLRPVPSKLLAFAVEFGGFARHGVLRLQERQYLQGSLQLFDVLAGVSPDYAIIAQKDGPAELLASLDAEFAHPRGIDLHTLAQFYQQQLDSVPLNLTQLRAHEDERAQAVQQQLDAVANGLGQLRNREDEHAHAVQQQLDDVADDLGQLRNREDEHAHAVQRQLDDVAHDLGQLREHKEQHVLAVQRQLDQMSAQIAHVHATTVELTSKLAEASALRERRAGDLVQIEHAHAMLAGQLAELQAIQLSTAGRATQAELAHGALADQLTQVEASHARILGRLQTVEAAQHLQGEHATARMRSRIAGVEQQQSASVSEHARLAAHVAWIEGRLAHAEAEAAALRHQLAKEQQRHSWFAQGALRIVHGARQGLSYRNLARQLRQPATALLQRLVRATLRRPALKRLARGIVTKIPGLHSRLLHIMYAQAPANDIVPVDVDPLTTQMSPRTFEVYRVLSAQTKQED